jgi:membrane protein DedA with SNARE-associated domain
VGRIGTLWASALGRTESLVRQRGVLGVTVARAIPFVRTMMPWFAGRSGMSWPRFLLFDALGVMLWGAIYIGGGFLAGRGWRGLVNVFGEVAGGALLVSAVLAALLLTRRYLRGRIASRIRRRFPRPPAPAVEAIDPGTPGREV